MLTQKDKCPIFSHLWMSFELLDVCASLRVLTRVREWIRGYAGGRKCRIERHKDGKENIKTKTFWKILLKVTTVEIFYNTHTHTESFKMGLLYKETIMPLLLETTELTKIPMTKMSYPLWTCWSMRSHKLPHPWYDRLLPLLLVTL